MNIRVQASVLLPHDITLGTGETVISVSEGLYTPSGKVEVVLEKKAILPTDVPLSATGS